LPNIEDPITTIDEPTPFRFGLEGSETHARSASRNESDTTTPMQDIELELNLRVILATDLEIESFWSDLGSSTRRVIREYTATRHGHSLQLNLTREYGEQRNALDAFLAALEECATASDTHLIRRMSEQNGFPIAEGKLFSAACRQLRVSILPRMAPENCHRLCEKVVDACTKNSFSDFYGLFRNLDLYEESHSILLPRDYHSISERRQLISGVQEAFAHPYQRHALDSFIRYLDIQWVNMCQGFDEVKGTTQSFCGTIVQSSCTGKSRLVQRCCSRRFS
jgi:hypothetical protein